MKWGTRLQSASVNNWDSALLPTVVQVREIKIVYCLTDIKVKTVDKHAPIKMHRIKHYVQPDWVTTNILEKKNKQRDNLKNMADLRIINMHEMKCPHVSKKQDNQYIKQN